MPPPNDRMRFDALLSTGTPTDLTRSDPRAFRMLVLAEFGGTVAAPIERIDRDNFDTFPGRLGVSLSLPGLRAGGDLAIAIRTIDDFDPDQLLEAIPAFEDLRQLKRRLGHPTAGAAAAAEVRGWTGAPAPVTAAAAAKPQSGADFLAGLLGEAPPAPAPESDWTAFLRRTVSPHVIEAIDPDRAALEARVDTVIAGLLRSILHHPRFRAIEAAWRGLAFLIKKLDTDTAVHLYAADVPRSLLAEAIGSLTAPRWDVIVGDYAFGPTVSDAEVVGKIAAAVAATGATFVAGGTPGLAGCESFAQFPDPDDWTQVIEPDAAAAWKAVRSRPEAASVGLAVPRFLLRPPYGKDGREVDRLRFEELAEGAGPSDLAWGNAAFGWAFLLGDAAGHFGSRFGDQLDGDLLSLPIATFDGDMIPCAEGWLGQSAVDRLDRSGLTVLQSVRGEDRARFASLRSLSGRPLAGRWR